MQLRDYQVQALRGNDRYPGILKAWDEFRKILICMPGGCGKTIIFSHVAREIVAGGGRVLILCHRGELLSQAQDKLKKATGLSSALEKAESSSVGCFEMVTVGSIQSLLQEQRRANIFAPTHIICDEAHHSISDSWQNVLNYWPDAKVLGVTATPDRGDFKELGTYYEKVAFEYSLSNAVHDGYLCPMRALTMPISIDLRSQKPNGKDWSNEQCASILEPYIPELARMLAENAKDRKSMVFVPLCATGKKVVTAVQASGLRCYYADGEDRSQIADYEADGRGSVMVNAMLLGEGYDHPPIDCIAVWRFTKSRPFYAQMIFRGTRIHPGKENLLILDNLFLTETHRLCRPASLLTEDDDVAEAMSERQDERKGTEVEMSDAELEAARQDVIADREAALAKKLSEMRNRKRALVDPLQYAMSVGDPGLADYQPAMPAEMAAPTPDQIKALDKAGIWPQDIQNAGHASAILQKLQERKAAGLAQPRQIRCLERYGIKNAGAMRFDAAQKIINGIAANGWRVSPAMLDRIRKTL